MSADHISTLLSFPLRSFTHVHVLLNYQNRPDKNVSHGRSSPLRNRVARRTQTYWVVESARTHKTEIRTLAQYADGAPSAYLPARSLLSPSNTLHTGYRSLAPIYFRNSAAALIVYDVSQPPEVRGRFSFSLPRQTPQFAKRILLFAPLS